MISRQDIKTAKDILKDTQDTCGIRHITEEAKIAKAISDAKTEARKQAIEECAHIADTQRLRLMNGGARNACKSIHDAILAILEVSNHESGK